MCVRSRARRSARAPVPSGELSSTTMIRASVTTERMFRTTAPRLATSLYVGITTVTECISANTGGDKKKCVAGQDWRAGGLAFGSAPGEQEFDLGKQRFDVKWFRQCGVSIAEFVRLPANGPSRRHGYDGKIRGGRISLKTANSRCPVNARQHHVHQNEIRLPVAG